MLRKAILIDKKNFQQVFLQIIYLFLYVSVTDDETMYEY